jgi:hypothetical protein
MQNQHCSECWNGEGPYKCPQCRAPYCSIECFRSHKLRCPAQFAADAPPPAEYIPPAQSVKSPFESFREHPQIIRALGDPRLQAIITRIDASPNREADLVRELEINPEFKLFVDQMLHCVPPDIQP